MTLLSLHERLFSSSNSSQERETVPHCDEPDAAYITDYDTDAELTWGRTKSNMKVGKEIRILTGIKTTCINLRIDTRFL